ncbi:hypothetical protein A2U01_0045946, partial [Trifolium medium]|nr:hypothetical protein [Trifolium medium]
QFGYSSSLCAGLLETFHDPDSSSHMPQPDNVRKGSVRGYSVLAVVSFVTLRGSMVILAILAFVVLSSVD